MKNSTGSFHIIFQPEIVYNQYQVDHVYIFPIVSGNGSFKNKIRIEQIEEKMIYWLTTAHFHMLFHFISI